MRKYFFKKTNKNKQTKKYVEIKYTQLKNQ